VSTKWPTDRGAPSPGLGRKFVDNRPGSEAQRCSQVDEGVPDESGLCLAAHGALRSDRRLDPGSGYASGVQGEPPVAGDGL
jgi:hypothetical protein